MKYLIQIGLNSVSPSAYGGWDGQLTDCEADLQNLFRFLPTPSTTWKLITANATATKVRWAFQQAALSAKPGDLVVVQYSGHGGQMPDLNGDEADNLDETWCLFDGQIIDDEINQWLQAFKAGVKVVVFSDSCHSASVAKLAPKQAVAKKEGAFWEFLGKPVTSPIVGAIVTAAIQKRDGSMPPWYQMLPATYKPDKIKAMVLLIAGCQDKQSSTSTGRGGVFTNAVVKELGCSTPSTFGTMFKNVVKECVKHSGQEPSWLELGAKFDWSRFKF